MKTTNNITQAVVQIPLKDISISPFNSDRWGNNPPDEESLKELAASIKTHDVIQAVVLRPRPEGKFELVVGERRFRASKIAGKKAINATVRELTDEQVQEIQLIENMQRENPHPMAEALAIQKLLALSHIKNRVEEVANRIGKSPAYVYQRAKLCDLNEKFREMYFANAINTTQALKIARLDTGSQEDFYSANCESWQDEGWSIYNFNYRIQNYQLELDDAPFSIKDAKLDKKAGACTKCPHNTAVTTSLFPEDSKDARCTNRPCYENKCRLFAILNIAGVIKNNPGLPIAVPDDTALTIYFSSDDELLKGREILIEEVDFGYHEEKEEKPDRKNFTDYEEEDENETEYQDALSEYETEVQRLEDEVSAGNYRKAILISERDFGKIVYLEPVREKTAGQPVISQAHTEFKAKDYQEAVKSKTLTADTIAGEKQRLQQREKRSRELDEIKLQENFYAALQNYEAGQSAEHAVGYNDRAVMFFIGYESLSYHWRSRFTDTILERVKSRGEEDDKLMEFFFNATDNELSVLARFAILNNSSAKNPDSLAGQMLRRMVKGTPGMDAAELESIQNTVRKERENKLNEKLLILDKQAEKLA
jgi:ParB family chromosome partitioning protein